MRLPVAAAVLVLGACGGAPEVAPSPAWPSEIDAPRVRTVGDFPPDDATVVVSCTGDGRLDVGGTPVGHVSDLAGILATRVARDPDAPGGVSPTNVLLAFDRAAPWSAAAWTLQACAHPKVSAPRVFFLVRRADDGGPGAFAAFLPEDRCFHGGEDAAVRPVRVTIRAGAVADDPAVLAAWLHAGAPVGARRDPSSSPRTRHGAVLDVAPDAPLGVVLAAADAAARGGAVALTFVSGPGPDAAVRDWFRPASAAPPGTRWGIFLPEGALPGALPAPPPAPPRIAGAYAGFADADAQRALLQEEEEKPPLPEGDLPR